MNRLVEELPTLLPEWLTHQRWFGAKGRPVRSVAVAAVTPLITEGDPLLDHVLLRVSFDDAGEHYYQLLVGRSAAPRGELEHVTFGAIDGLVAYDGLWDLRVTEWLLTALREGRTIGGLRFVPEPGAKIAEGVAGRVLGVEQSNTSVSWGERSILKLFRRVLPGLNPDLEVHRALRSVNSNEVAALQGAVEGTFDGEPFTLAMLQDFAANSADGWSMALASVRDLLAEGDLRADEVGGDFAGEASRLGETVAVVHDELRRALGETSRDARELAAVWHERLGATVAEVPALTPYVDAIRATYDAVAGLGEGMPTQRVHGDLHLGQTLRTPRGWLLIDFEGEPAAPLAERVRPDSALRDVAGMLRSFDYVAHTALAARPEAGRARLRPALEAWKQLATRAFLSGYLMAAGKSPERLLPRSPEVLRRACAAFELEKACYELRYELNNRPDWISIPLAGISRLLE